MIISQGIQRREDRLNKLSSFDYSNISKEEHIDHIEKAINDWVRRQVHGNNIKQEGDEQTSMRVDDLQCLLKSKKVSISNFPLYVEGSLPSDYRYFKRLSPLAKKGDCELITIPSDEIEEANVDIYLKDWSTQPSYDFEQCFHTFMGNKFKIYHNGDFEIPETLITYYKAPKKYSASNLSEVFEFKDDVMELIIDESIKITAGDIEYNNAESRAEKRTEENN